MEMDATTVDGAVKVGKLVTVMDHVKLSLIHI